MQEAQARLLIVGGGHAGLLLALTLDHAGVPVTVIETQPVEAILAAPFDGRALALMYGSKRVLDGLDLWPSFADIAEPVHGVRVRDQSTGATVSYDAVEVGAEAFAYGIANRALHRRLLELARGRPGITLLAPARLTRLERRARAMVATLEDGRRLAAELVVGADGRNSAVRELARIGVQQWRYPQTALTFALRLSRPHDHCVHEFLRPAGPLALLPLGPASCSVTWIEAPAAADQLLADPATLLLELQDRIERDLGPAELCGHPTGYPLSGLQAARYAAPRVALAGDAAHGLHPIHAQGFNLAVRDVAALAEVVVDGARAGADLGSSEILVRYDRWRRADARLMVGLTDGLNRLFSNNLPAARLVRGLGLTALDRVAPLKQLAMRRGMGLEGDLPKLARGEAL